MSQRHSSQGRHSQGGSSDEDILCAAKKAVHFLLAHAGAHNAPVKYVDLKKGVFQNSSGIDKPLKLAGKMLSDVFGYDLHIEGNKSKVYYLTNKFPNEGHITLPWSTEAYRTLLSLILAFILMNRGEVEQKNLLKFLQQMEINVDGPHPYFGDVARLLLKQSPIFVQDQFLDISTSEKGTYYKWGPRAKKEVVKLAVLKFVCEILGSNIEDWKCMIHQEEMDTEDS